MGVGHQFVSDGISTVNTSRSKLIAKHCWFQHMVSDLMGSRRQPWFGRTSLAFHKTTFSAVKVSNRSSWVCHLGYTELGGGGGGGEE